MDDHDLPFSLPVPANVTIEADLYVDSNSRNVRTVYTGKATSGGNILGRAGYEVSASGRTM